MTEGSKEGVADNRPRRGHRPDHQRDKVTPLRSPSKPRKSPPHSGEPRYRMLFDAMTEGFALHEIICDADGRPCDYRFLEVNPAFERQSGLKAADLIGRTIREVMPDIEPSWIERYARVALTGKAETFQASSKALGRDFEVRAYQAGPGRFATMFTNITGRKHAERTAHESALFPRQNPFPVLRIGFDGTLLYANGASAALLRTWKCRVGQVTPSQVRQAIEKALGTGTPGEIEILCGSILYSFAIAPIQEEDYANLYGRDVTKRKQAEEALAASERKHRELIETANSVVIRWDNQGIIRFVNEYGVRLLGYQRHELVGRHATTMIPDVESTGRDLSSMVKDILNHPDQHVLNPNENLRKDGTRVWIAWTNKAIVDENGNVQEILAIGSDITELKQTEQALQKANEKLREQAEELAAINEELQSQAEELQSQTEELRKSEGALRRSEQRLRWALQGAGGGAWEWDLSSNLAWWSREMYDLWGVEPGTPMHLDNTLAAVLEQDRERVRRTVEEAIARRVDYQCEFRIRHATRGVRWMASYGRVASDESGQPTHLLGITLDITERKQVEENLRQQGAILGGINRILLEALHCQTDEELGGVCLTVAEEVTTSQFGFIAELAPDDRLDILAISNPGWAACSMAEKTSHSRLPVRLRVHGIYDRVLGDSKGFFTNDPPSHPDSVGIPEGYPVLTAFLGVPLVHDAKTIGVFCLGNREGGYRQEDLDAVEALAPAVVEALMRTRAERALREGEQRLRTALEGGRMGLWEWDVENDRSYWDGRVQELTGICERELVRSEVFFDRVHRSDRNPLRAQIHEALANGSDFQAEFRVERPKGETVWLTLRSKILCDDEGRGIRMLGVLYDVTQRKRMEEALCRLNDQLEEEVQAQTEELKNTVERLQDEVSRRRLAEKDLYDRSRLLDGFFQHTITPLAFMDREFNFVQVNDAYAKADAREPEDFIGKNHFALYPHAENRAIFEEVVRTKQPYHALAKPFCYVDRPERGVTYWNWQLTPLLDDAGRVQFLVLNLQDVTERQEAMQELEKRTSQLQRLTAELSEAEDRERHRLAELLHDDLQQLLVGSKLRLNILARKIKNTPEIRGIVEEATSLIAESIQKSRGLSHELSPPVLHHGDLREVLQWLIEQIHTTCGLKVRLRIGDGVDVRSQTLKTFTYKAAREMLFNVVKHANVKRAAIIVQQTDESLCLTVSDRGRGFESERLDIASQNGFGLFHIRERVQLLGGSVRVLSIPGRGSRIVLTIPRNVAEETTITRHGNSGPSATTSTVPMTREAAESRPAERRFRVLLVDDHKVMRDGLAALLEEEPDIEVVGQAGNGRDAITLTARLKPDVVVMDVVMPIINGEEATRQIKDRWPCVRVVALSMLEEDATRERMILAGAEAFLSKAGPSEVIAAAIRHSS